MLTKPLTKIPRRRVSPPVPVQEVLRAAVKKPDPHPDAVKTAEQDRPYRDIVEDETRKYWRDTVKIGSLAKPKQQEIRAAAMPILVQGLRRRTGGKKYVNPCMARRAVADLVQHAREQGWIWLRTYPEAYRSPFHIDVLLQLAEDADWHPKEIPLPRHPGLRHPPVYYCNETSKAGDLFPVTIAESLIRGDYVLTVDGRRITDFDHICPWPYKHRLPDMTGLIELELDSCYVLRHRRSSVWVEMYWLETFRDGMQMEYAKLEDMRFGHTGFDAAEPTENFSLAPGEISSPADNRCNAFMRFMLSALSRPAVIILQRFPALRRLVLDDPAV